MLRKRDSPAVFWVLAHFEAVGLRFDSVAPFFLADWTFRQDEDEKPQEETVGEREVEARGEGEAPEVEVL